MALTALMASGVALANIWMLSLSTGNTQNCYPASIINTVGASSFGPDLTGSGRCPSLIPRPRAGPIPQASR